MKKIYNTPPAVKKSWRNKIQHTGFFVNLMLTILLAMGLTSCRDDLRFSDFGDEVYDADEVSMPFYLSVAPIEGEDPKTRAWTYIEASEEEKTIADIWFIQYNEVGNRVGLPRYYEVSNSVTDGHVDHIEMKDFMILVPREEDHDYTCVVIANTHNSNLFNADNRAQFSTLDALRRYDLDVHNQEDLFDPEPEDQHEIKYLLMSGWTKINKDTKEFKVNLIRNTSKVNVKLRNFCDDQLIIKYIQWVNMPLGKLFPHGTVENYVEPVSRDWRMHNEDNYFDDLFSDEGLTFWVPCNVWLPEEDLPDKPSTASVDSGEREEDPTHFDIVCRSAEEDDLNLYEFRIFPSRDGNIQCNFEPNHYYHITVDIDAIPQEENDFFKKTVFNDLGISNCFILQQDTKGVYVIGLDRPNTFWRYNDDNMVISDGMEWVAEVIWQDTNQRVVDFAIFSIGEVSKDRSRFFGYEDTCIPFRTTGTGLGNVIIGVRMKYDGEEDLSREELDEEYPIQNREYLWSWHLWITDYEPDKVDDLSTSFRDGAYQVPGGQVIQLNINKSMDRNLGAWAPEVKDPRNPDDIINTFGLYYQYGRKDPFPYFNPDRRHVYDIDGNLIDAFNTQEVTFWLDKRTEILDENGTVLDKDGNPMYDYWHDYVTEKITMVSSDENESGSFVQGVMQPYKFWADWLQTYHWASDASSVDVVTGWYYPQWYEEYCNSPDFKGDLRDKFKNIFDPCPAGWTMISSLDDFVGYDAMASSEDFFGQKEYLLWKGYEYKYEDYKDIIEEYLRLQNEFWEDLNGEDVAESNAPAPFMGSYLYYRWEPGTTYFPAAGSRNKYGAGDRFHNYMCLPWIQKMLHLTSFGWYIDDDEEFSTAVAMQVRCVKS